MKKSKLIASGLALTLALSACGSQASGLRASDKPHVSINGDKISKKDFYKQYDLYAQVQALNNQLAGQVINIFERDYIIKKDIKDNKIEVKEEEYKKAIDEAINNIGGKDAFKDYLSYMNTTKEVFEQNIKANVDSKAHAKWFNEKNPVKEEKLKEIYEQRKDNLDWIDTNHILVKTEEEANKVYEELNQGAEFKKLSDKYSIDESAKKQGGAIGKTVVSNLDPKYVEGAKSLEKGKYSKPVKSSFGYHIILLNDKAIGIEANKEQLTNIANTSAIEEYISKKIKELDIKLYDNKGNEIKNKGENKPEQKNQEKTTDKDKK